MSDLDWQDVEPVHIQTDFDVPAADLGGGTGQGFGEGGAFRGVNLLDMEDLIDRDEMAILLRANIRSMAMAPSTQTADGSVHSVVEIATDDNVIAAADTTLGPWEDVDDNGGFQLTPQASSTNVADNTDDIIGRVLESFSGSPFSDGATGVGGAGSTVIDEFDYLYPVRDGPAFDQRDDLYINGFLEHSNVSDAAIHVATGGVLWFVPVPHPLA